MMFGDHSNGRPLLLSWASYQNAHTDAVTRPHINDDDKEGSVK